MSERGNIPAVSSGEPFANAAIAALIDQIAELLDAQAARPARIAGYRRAAVVVRAHARPVADVLAHGGVVALAKLVNHRFAGAIAEIAATGRLGLLDALCGEVHLDSLFGAEVGIGPRLVRRVQEALGIVTVTELEIAARDGRLANVRGFGNRRVAAIHERLASRLGRGLDGRRALLPVVRVPVDELLDVDGEYREEAAAGRLPRLAPRAGGPGPAWLPILHTVRKERHYTAIVAESALMHELGTTRDWVVVHVEDPHGNRQAMVVTETEGPLAGHRMVRGREREGHAANG